MAHRRGSACEGRGRVFNAYCVRGSKEHNVYYVCERRIIVYVYVYVRQGSTYPRS